MKNSFIRKTIVLLLVTVFIISLLPDLKNVSAASKPSKPKISVSVSDDGSTVTLTIKKTKRAEGYEIAAKVSDAKDFTEIATIDLDGTKKRTITVNTLPSGIYSIKVRAYAVDNGKKVYSKYSKTKKVTVINEFNPELLGISQGDIVTFGAYEQDDNKKNGKEPIEWIVLSNDGGKLFMVSVYALERGIVDDDKGSYDGSWKNSDIRKHLNEEFLKDAFSDTEIAFIADTELEDSDCTDKVFLLSSDEVKNKDYGFESKKDRSCTPSDTAFVDGVYVFNDYTERGGYYVANDDCLACYWWLRTSKNEEGGHAFYLVEDNGSIGYNYCWGDDYYTGRGDEDEDFYIEDGGFGIRPAIVVNLKSGVQNVLTKTEKTMKEEWANAGESNDWDEDDDDDYDW
ncbi:MAG: DUF6273 domain-containing protein [Lachnospiraceae bacterium]|nr:DUF6273 domain-containing protein [Lachnospiraceae bacterium]